MNPLSRSSHLRAGRSRPRLERLEGRALLSLGPYLTVLGTDPPASPATGSVLTASPQTIGVFFDRPLDPNTLGFGFDVELEQIDAQGNMTPVAPDLWNPPTEALDSTGTELITTLNETLQVGHYEIVLSNSGAQGLAGLDGSMVNDPNGTDIPLGDFTIENKGVTLADAKNLGTPPATAQTVASGNLDFQTNPFAVDLYKFTLPALPEGALTWRLGAEIWAQRSDSALDSALALFDANGQVIGIGTRGRSDAPLDPYLFAGLKPGTYYLGVSGAGNLPGPSGGYNPADGSAGTVPQTQPGGSYTLHMIANAIDQPIQLINFHVDQADPLSPQPTGITLGFSGALDLSNNWGVWGSNLNQSIEVVDQSGKIWPVAVVGYDEAKASISYLFMDTLPVGQYTVRLPSQGGLKDLAGLSPVAPGELAGVLGSFTVQPHMGPNDPHDLGAVPPDVLEAGVNRETPIAPGDTASYRIVILYPTLYSFGVTPTGGPITVGYGGAQGSHILGTVNPGGASQLSAQLAPGVYTIQLVNSGDRAVQAQLTVDMVGFRPESVLSNGVGQGPALNLVLIAPPAPETPAPLTLPAPPAPIVVPPPVPSPAPSSSLSSDPTSSASITSAPSASSAETGTEVEAASSTVSASPSTAPSFHSAAAPPLFLALGSDLVGRPSTSAEHITIVGPGTGPDATVVAFNGGLPAAQALGRGPGVFSLAVRSGSNRPDRQELLPPPTNGAMIEPPGADEPATDSQALAQDASWLDQIGAMVADWFALPTRDQDAASAGVTAESLRGLLAERSTSLASSVPGGSSTTDLPPDEEKLDQAALTSPLTAGLAAALIVHYRHRIQSWFDQRKARNASASDRKAFHPEGPHRIGA
jgi:hypothetical protein